MKNKRKNERLNCAVPVDGKQGSLFGQIQTVDFSKGGLGFLSHQKLPLNKKIAIELDLDEFGDPVLVVGKVCWVRPEGESQYRVGIVFDEMFPGSKSRLDKYFRK